MVTKFLEKFKALGFEVELIRYIPQMEYIEFIIEKYGERVRGVIHNDGEPRYMDWLDATQKPFDAYWRHGKSCSYNTLENLAKAFDKRYKK